MSEASAEQAPRTGAMGRGRDRFTGDRLGLVLLALALLVELAWLAALAVAGYLLLLG